MDLDLGIDSTPFGSDVQIGFGEISDLMELRLDSKKSFRRDSHRFESTLRYFHRLSGALLLCRPRPSKQPFGGLAFFFSPSLELQTLDPRL